MFRLPMECESVDARSQFIGFHSTQFSAYDQIMRAKPTGDKPALEEFTRTMKALFRVPKSAVQESRPKPRRKPAKRPG